jgi:leucyl-tRNA synthetase
LREKYGLTEEMVSLKPIPIINIPGYGNMAAQAVCDKLGIQSQNDREKLATAKEETYKLGFYEGVMCGDAVGKYNGMKVIDAKALVREEMFK